MKTQLIFIFSIGLLLQVVKPQPLEGGAKLTERQQLEIIAIEELARTFNESAHQYKEIYESTIKDVEALPDISEDMRKEVQGWKDFVSDVEKIPKTLDDTFLNKMFFSHPKVLNSQHVNQVEGNKIIEILKKNGYDAAAVYSEFSLVIFTQNVMKRFQKWKALPESEKKLDDKVVAWYIWFKANAPEKNRIFKILELLNYE